MSTTASDLQAQLRETLSGLEEIRLAYVFGSRVTGLGRRDSDLDLAVVYASRLGPRARARARLDVIAALTDALGPLGERADVVDLQQASSAIGFRAIRDGHCVLARDRVERVRTEARIARLYDDEAPRREIIRRAAVRAGLRLGGLGPWSPRPDGRP